MTDSKTSVIPLAVTLGDPAGIGPEVALRAATRPGAPRCVLLGERATALRARDLVAPGLDIVEVSNPVTEVPEASPTGAPTTSTTMTLALGDALAMALMERHDFTAEQFKTFHPGGKLGTQLMVVAELMHAQSELPLIAAGAPMHDVLLTMTSKSFGAAGVVDEQGGLLGIITDGDLRRHMEPRDGRTLIDHNATEVMTPGPKTIRQGALVAEALGFMNDRNITCLFVVADGDETKAAPKPVGILHIHDCLRAGFV